MDVHVIAMLYTPFEAGYLYLLGVEELNNSNNLGSCSTDYNTGPDLKYVSIYFVNVRRCRFRFHLAVFFHSTSPFQWSFLCLLKRYRLSAHGIRL